MTIALVDITITAPWPSLPSCKTDCPAMRPCPAMTLARGHNLLSVRMAVTSSDSGTNSAATSGGAVLTVASATPKLAGSHTCQGKLWPRWTRWWELGRSFWWCQNSSCCLYSGEISIAFTDLCCLKVRFHNRRAPVLICPGLMCLSPVNSGMCLIPSPQGLHGNEHVHKQRRHRGAVMSTGQREGPGMLLLMSLHTSHKP